jgi:hypothetical protein
LLSEKIKAKEADHSEQGKRNTASERSEKDKDPSFD